MTFDEAAIARAAQVLAPVGQPVPARGTAGGRVRFAGLAPEPLLAVVPARAPFAGRGRSGMVAPTGVLATGDVGSGEATHRCRRHHSLGER